MKEVVLDTETTGFNVSEGHRIVEIGCIELDNLIPTQKNSIVILIQEEKFQKKPSRFMGIQANFYLHKKNLVMLWKNFLNL